MTEERCCSNEKGWVVFRTYQPQFSAHFCEIPTQIISAPKKILIHEGVKEKSPSLEHGVAAWEAKPEHTLLRITGCGKERGKTFSRYVG